MIYLELQGKFTCPDCNKTMDIDESFERNEYAFDTEIAIECSCGLEIRISVNFNDDLEVMEDEYEL